ncbi:hypothetical protein [Streptomyces sp. NPDC093149]|uniref:hypothetical protein n=1 Tax=Streptomyces sp. NPDC093149 TaxID=3366031 RepID=UPI0037FF7DB1
MKRLQVRHALIVLAIGAVAVSGCSGGDDAKGSDAKAPASHSAEKPAEKSADAAAQSPTAGVAQKD